MLSLKQVYAIGKKLRDREADRAERDERRRLTLVMGDADPQQVCDAVQRDVRGLLGKDGRIYCRGCVPQAGFTPPVDYMAPPEAVCPSCGLRIDWK